MRQLGGLIQALRRAALPREVPGLTDADLPAMYLGGRGDPCQCRRSDLARAYQLVGWRAG
jgi:hypothetical protein